METEADSCIHDQSHKEFKVDFSTVSEQLTRVAEYYETLADEPAVRLDQLKEKTGLFNLLERFKWRRRAKQAEQLAKFKQIAEDLRQLGAKTVIDATTLESIFTTLTLTFGGAVIEQDVRDAIQAILAAMSKVEAFIDKGPLAYLIAGPGKTLLFGGSKK